MTAHWWNCGTKDTLGEAIASIRYQDENWTDADNLPEFKVIEVDEKEVFQYPCPHDELDHGICMECSEDRDFNSPNFGKTIHEL